MVCGDLEGWDGAGVGGRPKRKGIYVYTLLTHFAVQQTLTQHCKATMGGKVSEKGKEWVMKIKPKPLQLILTLSVSLSLPQLRSLLSIYSLPSCIPDYKKFPLKLTCFSFSQSPSSVL